MIETGQVQYAGFDNLAERTLAFAQLQKLADPQSGYNPLLRDRVNWPWFIFSQFVFGVVAAVVVVRTETIHVPPAGSGPAGQPEGSQ